MLVFAFDPQQYRSPQRVWDAEKRQFLDEWDTTASMDFYYTDGTKDTVPIGFRYNKGSVPRILWWLIPRDDKAGIIPWKLHDYHYTEKNISRARADKIMYEILLIMGMSGWRAWMVYRGVRAAVWKNW